MPYVKVGSNGLADFYMEVDDMEGRNAAEIREEIPCHELVQVIERQQEESLQFLAQLLGKEGPEETKRAVDRGRVDMLIVRLADIRNTQAAINSQLVELGQKIG